jgi:hypothetical protein
MAFIFPISHPVHEATKRVQHQAQFTKDRFGAAEIVTSLVKDALQYFTWSKQWSKQWRNQWRK